ncbi:MAG: HIT family protein [Capsulimonadaceae bacterium]
MTSMLPDTCKLCRLIGGEPREGDVLPVQIGGDDHWAVVLNENQATLGRIYLVLRRHETDITALTTSEQTSLFHHTRAVKRAVDSLFAPDHYNYVFLMNLVRHCHFHIFPRYEAPRRFAGVEFVDSAYGGHYNPAGERMLDPAAAGALAGVLRTALLKEEACSHT